MRWISNLFSRYWRNVHFISVLLLSLILILGGGQVTGFTSGVVSAVFYAPFSLIKNTVVALATVNTDNERLQQALVEASAKVVQLEEMERENARLRAILGFTPPENYTLIPAEVVSVSGDHVSLAALINRGTRDSVEIDQPLINEQGLIGRVVSVSPLSATVQLLTDPTARVAVRIADSREMGIVKYQVGTGMILDNFPIQGSIKEGDLILSSGLGGIYPPGLVVGTVIAVERPEEEPFCRVRLQPAANFNSLEELFVLRVHGP
ncbi:MAG: rod shape-determining protein MreC [bacterium]|nr:rod shape-determining protein MreC [bacterium]